MPAKSNQIFKPQNFNVMETSEQVKTIKEKREELKALSNAVKPLVKMGQFDTVNEAVLQIYYQRNGHDVFKTFQQWKAEGFNVKKGEHAFYIWGRPSEKQKQEQQPEETPAEDGTGFFPLCFLFSNKQVIKAEKA
jgi:hypothetical protein